MRRGWMVVLCFMLWMAGGLAVSAAQEEETGIFFFHSEEMNAQRQAAQAVSSVLPLAEGDLWTLSKPSTTFGYTASAYADHKYWMRILLVRADDARWTGGALYGPAASYWGHRLTRGNEQVWAYCIEPNVGTSVTGYEESKEYAVRFMEKLKAYEGGALWRQMVRAMYLGDYLIARDQQFQDVDINAAANIVVWELLMGYVSCDGTYTYQNASASHTYPNEEGEALFRLFDTGAYQDFQKIHDSLLGLLRSYDTLLPWMGRTPETAKQNAIILRYQEEDEVYTTDWLVDAGKQLEPETALGQGSLGFEGLQATNGTVPGTQVQYEREGNKIRFLLHQAIEGEIVSEYLKKQGTGDGVTPSAYVSGVVYPSGSRTDGQILASTAQADGVGGYLAFRIEQIPVQVQIQKEAKGMEGLFLSHKLYSLESAQYGVYEDEACKKLLEVLTLDEKGEAQSENKYLPDRTLYIKEITAPPGFLLDTRVYEVTAGEKWVVYDEPVCCPIPGQIIKIDQESNEPIKNEARFLVEYFAQDEPGNTPNWSGVFATDAAGRLAITKEALIEGSLEGVRIDAEGYLLFPLGCVCISEVMAPTGYVLSEQILLGYIRQPRSGEQALWQWERESIQALIELGNGTYGYPNEREKGSITVYKHREGDAEASIPGALLELQRKTEGEWKKVAEAWTDEEGYAVFDGLLMGEYRLVEKQAPDGYMLLPAAIEITLPQENETEIWWNLEEEQAFMLPQTGGGGWRVLGILSVLLQTAGILGERFTRRKKEYREENQ